VIEHGKKNFGFTLEGVVLKVPHLKLSTFLSGAESGLSIIGDPVPRGVNANDTVVTIPDNDNYNDNYNEKPVPYSRKDKNDRSDLHSQIREGRALKKVEEEEREKKKPEAAPPSMAEILSRRIPIIGSDDSDKDDDLILLAPNTPNNQFKEEDTKKTEVNEQYVKQLMELGFEKDLCIAVLLENNNNFERSLDFILTQKG